MKAKEVGPAAEDFEMAKKKDRTPSSVVHYTSTEVINKMFSQALEKNDPNIIVHLSNLTMMNDADEGHYILNQFYTDSNFKKKLRQHWDKVFYPQNIPFVFSTIATNLKKQNGGSIPMWKMYGDDFKGGYIRFNWKDLKEFFNKPKFFFSECTYSAQNEVTEIIKDLNSISQEETIFDEILKKACFTKRALWDYEQEWRIVHTITKSEVKTKSTARGIIEYIELPIPINLIEEICLGSLSNRPTVESINLIKEQLQDKFPKDVHFTVGKSKISIQ